MSQKKPPTQQRADSSSDEDEEVEEEVESSESAEQDPKPVTPRAPVKPVVVQPAKSKPDLAPATAPAVTVGKKRQAESTPVSKKIKKRVAEDVVKNVEDYPKVFSETDEIMLLQALLDYSAEKSIDPIEDTTAFHDFVMMNYIHVDVTKDQLSRKIRSMKSKYKNHASKKKPTFGKEHDQFCYDISKMIWGKSSSGCGGSESKTTSKRKRIPKMKKNMTPVLQIAQVVVEEPVRDNISLSELAKTRDVVGMMCVSDDTFKKVLELLSDEARAALEDKWKNMARAELELNYKKLELSRELMKYVGR